MVAKFDHRSALLVSELTGFVENKRWKPLIQIHGVTWSRNRAHGAVGQNRTRSIKWA